MTVFAGDIEWHQVICQHSAIADATLRRDRWS